VVIGVKRIVNVHLALGASNVPQSLLWRKSGPTTIFAEIDSGVVELVLVMVKVFVAVTPTHWVIGKFTAVLDANTADPIPIACTTCGLVGSLSVIVIAAERGPSLVGLKVTLNLQLDAGPTEALLQPETVKSPGEIVIDEILIVVAPALKKV